MIPSALQKQLQLLPDYLGNHILLTILALVIGIAICLPLGAIITRVKALQWPALTFVGIMQTIPGLALLALMVPLLGMIGFLPALIALVVYSFLPILRNTVTGILGVDADIIEAARGIGMTDRQILLQVELPLALPLIIAGIRTAAVWVVGTATLATPVGATSLGNYIFSGLQTQNVTSVLVGSIAAALLAIAIDQLIRLAEIAASRRSRRLGIAASMLLLMLLLGGMIPLPTLFGGEKEKQTIVIGSKTFTEQYILSQLMAKLIEKNGFSADQRSGMGSIILFEALVNNSIDCYVDYSGTIWANAMKRKDTPPPGQVLEEMETWLLQNHGIVCLGALGFENTYALAVRKETAQKYGLHTIEDLLTIADKLSIGSDYEFFSRPEWNALQTKYGLKFRERLTLDPTLMYSAVANGEADVITAFSTDGRIIDFDLVLLEDTRHVFPPYDAVLLLSLAAATKTNLIKSLKGMIGKIDADAMRHANKMVDSDDITVDSAANFLQRQIGN